MQPRIELVAEDALDMRIPDNSGRQINGAKLSGTGDLKAAVPVKKWGVEDWEDDIELSKTQDDTFAMKPTIAHLRRFKPTNLQFLAFFSIFLRLNICP